MAQQFRKVKDRQNYHRKSTVGATVSEYQKREEMSPICAILLNVTMADDKTFREVMALANGRTIRTGSGQWRRNGREFRVCNWGTRLHLSFWMPAHRQGTEKKRKRNMDMNGKKIKNLLNMKKTIKMNGKKKNMKVAVNVVTKTDMNKSIEANTKLNMNTQMNMKMCVNTMLQMERRRCSFAGHRRGQIKAGVQERALTRRVFRRSPTLKCKASDFRSNSCQCPPAG
jgi:hypothetical protein